jgi:hypothetical protein
LNCLHRPDVIEAGLPRVISSQDSDHSLNVESRNSTPVVNEESYERRLKSTAGKIINSAGKRNILPRKAEKVSYQIVNVSQQGKIDYAVSTIQSKRKLLPSNSDIQFEGEHVHYFDGDPHPSFITAVTGPDRDNWIAARVKEVSGLVKKIVGRLPQFL